MRSNFKVQLTPHFRVLSDDQIEELHLATLEVLRRTGVAVKEPEGRELLKKAGCWVDGERVRLPAHLIEWALAMAPPRVILCDRNGRPAMLLEGYKVYYGTGSDCPYIIDPYTGERRQGLLQDVVHFARLVDALPNTDFLMCMTMASDIPAAVSDLYHFRAMLENTTKPLCYTAWNLDNLKDILAMCEAVAGGEEAFQRNPFAILYAEPISPLQHTIEGTQKLLHMARKRLPVIYTPGMMTGAAAPITSAGGLIVANAEMLSGLVMAQLAGEGAPFVYGGGVTLMDMSTMGVTYASPEFMLNTCALADMARYYRLPVFGFGACSDSKCFDQQAALEGGLWVLLTALSGGNLAHDAGYINSGLTASMEMTVMNDEAVGLVRRILGGVEVSDETMALDVIDQVGPGGHFLGEDHTYRHFRENWFPKLLDRSNYETWKDNGALTLGDRIGAKVRQILETHQPEALAENIKAELENIISRAEERLGTKGGQR
jgi:trimethylamine--corrinoid protein Co-methyltransferase